MLNVTLHFTLKSTVIIAYLRQPVTLLEAVQKIGALIAFFKIVSVSLNYIHFKKHEKSLGGRFNSDET